METEIQKPIFVPTKQQTERMISSGNYNAENRKKNKKTFVIDSNHGTNPFKQLKKVRHLFEKYEKQFEKK